MSYAEVVFPSSLSPSRASDYLQCPLLYRYRTIDALPEMPSAAAVRGTLVHSVLDLLFDEPAGQRNLALAEDLARNVINRMSVESPEELSTLTQGISDIGPESLASEILKPVRPLLTTYFAMEDPNRLEPHAREMAMSVELVEGFSIRGIIDRVDYNPAAGVRVVDYKTGRSPAERYADKAMFQLRFYALAWWRTTGEIPTTLQLMYLGDGRFIRYEPDEESLLVTERKILALRAAISDSAEQFSFLPRTSKLCGWCSFKKLCPSFNGTPPSFPERESWRSGSSIVENSLRHAVADDLGVTPQVLD